MAKVSVDFNDQHLRRNLKTFGNKLNTNISALMEYESAYATGWLKQNARWTDRTSAARTGLNTISFNFGNRHELVMSYSVYYGIWLEVANSGKWAIITPAMRIVGAKVMFDVERLIMAMGGKI